jgi:HlyD family secretion protein
MSKILGFIKKHKILSGIILILMIVGGFGLNKHFKSTTSQTSYVLSSVEKGSIISSVSGTGQVSDLDEKSVKSEVSADVAYLGVAKGETVSKGQLLLKLDTTNALDAIDTAQDNLDDAELALAKIEGYDTNSGHIRGTKEKAQTTLDTAYEDGFNAVEDAFLNLPSVMTDFYSVLFGNSFSTYQKNVDYYVASVGDNNETALAYKNDVYAKYQTAKTLYDQNLADYKTTSRYSSTTEIEVLINQSYETIKAISDAAKSANNLIQYYQEKLAEKGLAPATLSGTHLASVQSYMSKTNGYLSSLLSVKNTIQNSKESLVSVDSDISDQEKQVEKMQEALADAQAELDYYSIYAPVSGVITALNVESDGSVSAGGNIMTIATTEKVAKITLNEVDAAKIKVGQKVNLTFDAIEDLNITGTVSEIDTEGTVSSGVVSYGVTIAFDMQNDQVKSGMTVSANIITEAKQNILVVLASAVDSSGGKYYVQKVNESDILSGASSTGVILGVLPTKQEVTIGLSDDSSTEILTGLTEGDIIVTKTITSSSKSSSSKSSSSNSTTNNSNSSLLKTVSGSTGSGPGGPPGF